ncbi:MAG TPA: TRCF domain-containing protein, partial [Candidatus Manganitrophaceae bacterium]
YIPDSYQRLAIYKRLSGCEEMSETESIRSEMEDRYGAAPEPARRLLEVIQLKTMAKALRALKIEEKGRAVSFVFDESARLSENDLGRLLTAFGGRVHFTSSFSFEIQIRNKTWEDLFLETGRCLSTLQKGRE